MTINSGDIAGSAQTLLDQQRTQDLATLDALARKAGINSNDDFFLSPSSGLRHFNSMIAWYSPRLAEGGVEREIIT